MKTKNKVIRLLPLFFITCLSCNESQDPSIPLQQVKGALEETEIQTSDLVWRVQHASGLFCEFIPATDSTLHIRWGDSAAVHEVDETIYSYLVNPEKLYIDWHNEQFISLRNGTGSDTWVDVVLMKEEPSLLRVYRNSLTFDKENGIVIYEYAMPDSVIVAEDLVTGNKMVIGSDWKECGSAFPHYCIDSIHMNSGELYVEWVTPDYYSRDARRIVRKKIAF